MYIFCKIYGHFRLFVCLFIQCLLSLTFSSLVSEYALLCAALRCLCESVVRTRCSHCVVCLCLFYMTCSLCVYNAPSCHIENSVIFITTTVCPVALSVCSLQPRLARAILSCSDAVCGARVANVQRCGWLRFSLNHLLHCVGEELCMRHIRHLCRLRHCGAHVHWSIYCLPHVEAMSLDLTVPIVYNNMLPASHMII